MISMFKKGSKIPVANFAILSMTLYFMRLYLFAVNADGMQARQRLYVMYTAMLFLVSLDGVCITTKRNVVTAAVGSSFVMLQEGLCAPRRTTSEPAEHNFGTDRTFIR